jgi:hypothetical protein
MFAETSGGLFPTYGKWCPGTPPNGLALVKSTGIIPAS